jgi:hypothetical protein
VYDGMEGSVESSGLDAAELHGAGVAGAGGPRRNFLSLPMG